METIKKILRRLWHKHDWYIVDVFEMPSGEICTSFECFHCQNEKVKYTRR